MAESPIFLPLLVERGTTEKENFENPSLIIYPINVRSPLHEHRDVCPSMRIPMSTDKDVGYPKTISE
ncbi:hypothetical protein ACFLXJ_04090 [Chloroflexota bacterium]